VKKFVAAKAKAVAAVRFKNSLREKISSNTVINPLQKTSLEF